MSTAPKKPQDHQKKATGATEPEFTFDLGDKTYSLPTAEKFADRVPGGITADAILEPDNESAQIRLGLAMFAAIEGYDETKAYIRSLPSGEMFGILNAWMEFGDGSASVPQS